MPDQLDQFVSSKTNSFPQIYAYSDPHYPGMLKVGFTSRSVTERMAEHYPTQSPDGRQPYEVLFTESAMYEDGGTHCCPAKEQEKSPKSQRDVVQRLKTNNRHTRRFWT